MFNRFKFSEVMARTSDAKQKTAVDLDVKAAPIAQQDEVRVIVPRRVRPARYDLSANA